MTSMGAQCCQKEFKSFQVLATAATMNMRKKHGKTLSSVVDSRRKFGERHILRDGLRLRRGVGNQKGSMGPPKFRQNSATCNVQVFRESHKNDEQSSFNFDETCQVKTKRMVTLNYCGLLRKLKLCKLLKFKERTKIWHSFVRIWLAWLISNFFGHNASS